MNNDGEVSRVEGWLKIASGNTADIYVWKGKVIKLFKEYLPAGESMKEAEKQEFAGTIGLLVPDILEVREVEGRQAIVMEYIEGSTIGDLLKESPESLEHYMDISVDVQRQIHQLPADPLERMSDKLERQICEADELNGEQKGILLDRLQGISYEPKLCHGDFHFLNVILDGNKTAIIDWVDASAGDVRADVCRTYLLYGSLSVQVADSYLKTYCGKSGLLENEVLQWLPVLAAARLSEHISAVERQRLLGIVRADTIKE